MKTVLILCTGNSCRSAMAEGLLNHWGSGGFKAVSAGSFPTGQVNPMSLQTLARHGLPTDGYRSKSWDEFADQQINIVITVCDAAAGESCPLFPGGPVKAHWGVPDPAHAEGTADEVAAVFDRVYTQLERRVKALVALPVETMPQNELAAALAAIGKDQL
ncbi:arsenate reductase ArsC [soil metagenome]